MAAGCPAKAAPPAQLQAGGCSGQPFSCFTLRCQQRNALNFLGSLGLPRLDWYGGPSFGRVPTELHVTNAKDERAQKKGSTVIMLAFRVISTPLRKLLDFAGVDSSASGEIYRLERAAGNIAPSRLGTGELSISRPKASTLTLNNQPDPPECRHMAVSHGFQNSRSCFAAVEISSRPILVATI